MSKIESELNEEEKKEDFDISKENKKLYEKLMKDLGFLSDKEEKPKIKANRYAKSLSNIF